MRRKLDYEKKVERGRDNNDKNTKRNETGGRMREVYIDIIRKQEHYWVDYCTHLEIFVVRPQMDNLRTIVG